MLLVFRPVKRAASSFRIIANTVLRHQSITAFIRKLPSQRGGVIEGRRYETPPSVPCSPPKYAPILVVPIRVADQGVQNQEFRNPKLRLS